MNTRLPDKQTELPLLSPLKAHIYYCRLSRKLKGVSLPCEKKKNIQSHILPEVPTDGKTQDQRGDDRL